MLLLIPILYSNYKLKCNNNSGIISLNFKLKCFIITLNSEFILIVFCIKFNTEVTCGINKLVVVFSSFKINE